jgi:hypothetical protein
MEIVSTTDTPQQIAAALESNGYEVIPQTPTAAESAPTSDAPALPSDDGTTAVDPEATSEEPAPQPDGRKRGKALQARFDELTRDRYAEKGRADQLQRQIDALNLQIAGKPAAPATPAAETTPAQAQRPERPKMPRQSQFDTVEEFEEALNVYDAALAQHEEKLATFNRETAIREFQAAQQQQQAQIIRETAHDAGRAEFADYDAVVFNEDVKITGALLDTIWESENPERLLYWYGTHPEVAAEFARLTSYSDMSFALAANRNAVRAVAHIQASLKAGAPVAPIAPVPGVAAPIAAHAPVAAPQPRTTSAPAPARPLRGASGSPAAPDPNRKIGENGWTMANEMATMKSRRRGA